MSLRPAVVILLCTALVSCQTSAPASNPSTSADAEQSRRRPVQREGIVLPPLIEDLQQRTFWWFWDLTNSKNGLVPDRWPTKAFSSIAAVGFGLTVYPVGAERGWITRAQARERVLTTLEFFDEAPQGPAARGMTGHKGFFYHFLDMETGERFEDVELSSIDTTLLLAGALFAQSYFDGVHPDEERIRFLAEKLYREADWNFFVVRPPKVAMAWRPERGYGGADWNGLNEGAILYILALGSPTHPIDPSAWDAWVADYQWLPFYGYEHVNFAPLFGHQYSHIWIDFRGIQDEYFREKGIDFFENSRRAVLSQRAYAIDNPNNWKDYGENIWGLTACDGPGDGTAVVGGTRRQFWSYMARGAAADEIRDDGTIAPTAAAASIPFAPEVVIPAIEAMHERYGEHLYQKYGFLDAFNPSLTTRPDFRLVHGDVVPGLGWFNSDYLGIDQGPIVLMIENHRNGFVWEVMKKNPHIVRGLRRAGFRGGWLEEAR